MHFDRSANGERIEKAMAVYDSCLANNAAFSKLRRHKDRLKTRFLWKGIVSFSTPRPFFSFEERKKRI